MWICAGPRDPPTKPSRGWVRVVVRKPRLVLAASMARANSAIFKVRDFACFCGIIGRNRPVLSLHHMVSP